jgi:hypothetical protein
VAAADDERLPPRTLRLSLPALTPAQAEALLDLVTELHELVWAEYGDSYELRGDRGDDQRDDPDVPARDVDDPDF